MRFIPMRSADVPAVAERLSDFSAAPWAPLRRTPGVNSLYSATSFFRFVVEHVKELPPRGIVCGLGEHSPSLLMAK